MKILQVHNYYRYRGGEDRYVDILDRLLRQEGHEVIRFLSDSRDISQFGLWQKLKIPFKGIDSPENTNALEVCIDKEKPDLAIIHNLSPLFSQSLLTVLNAKGIPILKRLENFKFLCLNGLFLRNNYTVCESCKQGNFLHGVIHRCYQRSFINSLGLAVSETIHHRRQTVIRHVHHFLASSDFVKSKFVDAGFPEGKIDVYPNFIDFEPLETPRSPKNYAIYLGRLSKEKGLMSLLKAFRDLPELPLKILGDGPLMKPMQDYVKRYRMQHVTFEGFIDGDAKQELLAEALFLVFPSQCYESFGYTIVEGYACGLPAVAADIGSGKELVLEGKTGTLFRTGDSIHMKEQIQTLLADKQRLLDMRAHALTLAKEKYTMKKGYQNLMSVCRKLVDQTGQKETL